MRLCSARHVATCRIAFRRQFQLFGARIASCAFFCCCVLVSFSVRRVSQPGGSVSCLCCSLSTHCSISTRALVRTVPYFLTGSFSECSVPCFLMLTMRRTSSSPPLSRLHQQRRWTEAELFTTVPMHAFSRAFEVLSRRDFHVPQCWKSPT